MTHSNPTTTQQIVDLEHEHQQLHAYIDHAALDPSFDQLELRRLKKRKLVIKDTLMRLRSSLIPDQLA